MKMLAVSPLLKLEEQLLCWTNFAGEEPGIQEIPLIRALALHPQLNKSSFAKLIEENAVTVLTLDRLRKALNPEEYAPFKDILCDLQKKYADIIMRNEKRIAWTRKLLQTACEAGIPVVVLKGAMLADSIYKMPGYKKMNDLDILVKKSDVEKFISLLKSIRFQSVGALIGKKEFDPESYHTPPWVSEDLGCLIGLHWGLSSPHAQWTPDDIWPRTAEAVVAGVKAYRMSWEDQLLHLCIHLPFYKNGLRELADVYNLILFCEPAIQWSDFAERVRDWKAEDAAYRVLSLADAIVPLSLPTLLMKKWKKKSSRQTLQDTYFRTLNPSKILASRSTHIAKIEKAYAVFKLTENHQERTLAWAKMWKDLLYPKTKELKRITPSSQIDDNPSLLLMAKSRVAAPLRIWNAMARDHGQLPLILMTAANMVTLAKTSMQEIKKRGIRKAFSKESGNSIQKHPAYSLLEVLE